MPRSEVYVEYERGKPVLVWDNDVKVFIDFWSDGTPYVQVLTSPETTSWEELEVYMNDGKVKEWH